MHSPVRFSSCRGVAFEIKPHADPFAIAPTPAQNELSNNSNRFWFPWDLRNSSKIFLSSIQRSMSRPISHFCDVDFDEKKKKAMRKALYWRAWKKPESRLSIILLDQGLFTVYKRLFTVCLTLNIIELVLAATRHFPYARNRAALFSIGNILALTLCRSEAVEVCFSCECENYNLT
ncbi:hypothetical protein SLEP1_g7937 [Rubroshorea leprosula]|uniref:Uncharacterized protein n=1 Tax=Rubroshorea leprosula TaxID=152421 RepID=A0AAV5I8C6_9ROSI|nr:hypothetical protein SLEP1_g7937 [Rubroshorea leprosula]